MLLNFLPVWEHLETAVSHIPEEMKNAEWAKGFVYIKKEMDALMAKLDVKKIEVAGKPFDPLLAEAVSEEESKEHPAGEVLRELAKGYMKGVKVILPAKVVVSK